MPLIARSKQGSGKDGFTPWISFSFPRIVFLPLSMYSSVCVFLCTSFLFFPCFPFHEFFSASSFSIIISFFLSHQCIHAFCKWGSPQQGWVRTLGTITCDLGTQETPGATLGATEGVRVCACTGTRSQVHTCLADIRNLPTYFSYDVDSL